MYPEDGVYHDDDSHNNDHDHLSIRPILVKHSERDAVDWNETGRDWYFILATVKDERKIVLGGIWSQSSSSAVHIHLSNPKTLIL